MQTRRQFLQESAFWAGVIGMHGGFLDAIRRASAIEPAQGSSYLDAEHVVILMQENRSFDHMFGTLQGVRGFNDPHPITLPDGNPAFVQTNDAGKSHIPFRLDIKESRTTWMGCLPHSWADQVDAANGGRHDRWLQSKRSSAEKYADLPLTMGYHTRDDIPFYYALADAFTVCDQNFCSSLTGTTPNRLHLFSGTVRSKPTTESPALVRNEDCTYGNWTSWKTFPELLEDRGISWKIYQNELTVPTDLPAVAEPWISNYGDNPIEWFSQFNVRFHRGHREFLEKKIASVTQEIEKVTSQIGSVLGEAVPQLNATLKKLQGGLERLQKDLTDFTPENFQKLTPYEKSLHAKAFSINSGDPLYRQVRELTYELDGRKQRTPVPAGDVLFQLREDVAQGKLPAVSWIVAPERFSDHPSSPWYGQWYLSEILNILTSNPEVWKKTVFILTYDENDGYFDHVPPFQAPHPQRPETGRASSGLDTTLEYVELEQDRKHKKSGAVRGNSIGLGFRVPLIVASPWSRGGHVNSQVFDHTSVIRFLETLIARKFHPGFREENITAWRRTVCGDLTSVFHSENDASSGLKDFLDQDQFVEAIHRAQFQQLPQGMEALTPEQVQQIRQRAEKSPLPIQEPGTRKSCPLPYELAVDGSWNEERTRFGITLSAGSKRFGDESAGAPFIIYATTKGGLQVRHYAVAAGQSVEESWGLNDFDEGAYTIRVHGPNGFFREFRGIGCDPAVSITFDELSPVLKTPAKQAAIQLKAPVSIRSMAVVVEDNAYGNSRRQLEVGAGGSQQVELDLSRSGGWYDVTVSVPDRPEFSKRYAGRVETGAWSITDPAMA